MHCWYRMDSNYTEAQPNFQAHLAQPINGSAQAYGAQPASVPTGTDWYLDSGATHHVTNDINNLSSYMPYEGTDSLFIGNGSGMEISHVGSAQLTFSNYTFLLHDVLHVPLFTKNLLSLSKLLSDNSILIEFSSTFCVIKERPSMRPILQARLLNGLYTFPLHLSSPHALLGERVSMDLWHSRLGHPSSDTTLKVLQSHLLPCHSTKMSLCHHCCMAKAHRLPF